MKPLRSYSFREESNLEIWHHLFKDANEMGTRLDYTLEIFDAAVEGDIDLTREFKLEEYINKINHTRMLESLREAKRTVPVKEDSDDDGEESGVAYPADASDAYGELLDDCELQYAVEKLNVLNAYYMAEALCDVRGAVRQALKGIPQSIQIVKDLCGEYPVLADLLKIILGSGHPYESLFPDIK